MPNKPELIEIDTIRNGPLIVCIDEIVGIGMSDEGHTVIFLKSFSVSVKMSYDLLKKKLYSSQPIKNLLGNKNA